MPTSAGKNEVCPSGKIMYRKVALRNTALYFSKEPILSRQGADTEDSDTIV